eukprot:365207-Chlamydomonas_euryale.AAC.9
MGKGRGLGLHEGGHVRVWSGMGTRKRGGALGCMRTALLYAKAKLFLLFAKLSVSCIGQCCSSIGQNATAAICVVADAPTTQVGDVILHRC